MIPNNNSNCTELFIRVKYSIKINFESTQRELFQVLEYGAEGLMADMESINFKKYIIVSHC